MVVGVSDHAGWAVLVTVDRGKLVDRRRAELIEEGLPVLPHHHEAQVLSADEGVALVEWVQASAERCARAMLDSLPRGIRCVALRACPQLPPTIAERIASYRAQCMADGVMYRQAIAKAAKAKRWAVSWYDAKTVVDAPTRKIVAAVGKALGPPWQRDHQVAMAAALAAAKR